MAIFIQLLVAALWLMGCSRPGNSADVRSVTPGLPIMQSATPTLSSALPSAASNAFPPTAQSLSSWQGHTQFVAGDVTRGDSNRFIRGASLQNGGHVVLIPRTLLAADTPAHPGDPLVTFNGKMALRVELFDSRVAEQDGAGIERVDFQIVEDASGEIRFVNRDAVAPYCLFGGDEALCAPFDFAENGLRWPSGEPLTNGRYRVEMTIITTSGDGTTWTWPFAISGAVDHPNGDLLVTTPAEVADFSGLWYTNFAEVTLHQEGVTVTGRYARYGQQETLRLAGTVAARQLDGYFGNDPADRFRFLLSDDQQSFTGAWFRRGDDAAHDWCGARIGAGPLPAGCGFSGEWLLMGAIDAPQQAIAHLEQIGPNLSGVVMRDGVMNGGILGAAGPMTSTESANGYGAILANLGEGGAFPFHSANGLYTLNGISYPIRWELLDFNSEQFRGCVVFGETILPWCGWRRDGVPPLCTPDANCP